MRACTTANAIALGLVLAIASFAACGGSNSSTQSSQPQGAASTAPDETKAGTTGTETGAAKPSETVAPSETAAAKTAAKQPESAADCKEIQSVIVNEPPDSAVPMNNATAPNADAGVVSDRLSPLASLMKSNRDKFRCCFDLWGRKNPGGAGRVALRLKLDPEGKLTSSEIVAKDTTVTASEVHACMLEVAKVLPYPKSQSGKETTYTHPFDFKARH